jgi:hypothetical protein
MDPQERAYLRELARKQAEYAALPVMAERAARWRAHNACRPGRPMVVIELNTFLRDFMVPLRTTSPEAQQIERSLLYWIRNHELVDDDKVVPDVFAVNTHIEFRLCGLDLQADRASDEQGRSIGYHFDQPIRDLRADWDVVQPSTWRADREATAQEMAIAEDVLGDILPVVEQNRSLDWGGMLSWRALRLMSMEGMLTALMDTPDEFHRLMAFLRDDLLAYMRWQEAEGLLTLNNGNHYAGAGSYGYTDELPAPGYDGRVRLCDRWHNLNSQETVGVSPRMFAEFYAPYYHDIARVAGLVYFGCCEPVDKLWDPSLRTMPNLRKVSISPWCDQAYMGEALRGEKVIYSRKPMPQFLGVGNTWDEEGFAAHVAETLTAARGCTVEFIYRDVYALGGDVDKPGKAVRTIRRLIDEMWN